MNSELTMPVIGGYVQYANHAWSTACGRLGHAPIHWSLMRVQRVFEKTSSALIRCELCHRAGCRTSVVVVKVCYVVEHRLVTVARWKLSAREVSKNSC